MRNLTRSFPLIVTMATVLTASVAQARPVNKMSVEKMWKVADLVVIGTIKSNTDFFVDESSKPGDWIPVNSVFDVQAVCKGAISGDRSGKNVTLSHYRYYDPKFLGYNGPVFVRFDTKQKNQYLMFLKYDFANSYSPVSGFVDPHYSFRLLQKYGLENEKSIASNDKTIVEKPVVNPATVRRDTKK